MDYRVIFILVSEAMFALFLMWRQKLLNKPMYFITAVIFVGLAFSARALVLDYETLDYKDFLSHWLRFFSLNGGFEALRYPVGNYNLPYLYFLALFSYSDINGLYLIKLLSIFFDVVLAAGISGLGSLFIESRGRQLWLFISVLFLPTVFLNSALWGQCDSIYAAFGIWGLYLALKDRPCLSMICFALSFGFKLQAVFLLPVCGLLWMYKKYSWKHFFIFPAAYIALMLPAVFFGRPLGDTLTLYLGQTGSIGSALNYNSPSIFAILYKVRSSDTISSLAVASAFLFMLAVLVSGFIGRRQLNDKAVCWGAVLFSIGIPFLLPHMHDRYFFIADVLCLCLAFVRPELCFFAFIQEFASFSGYYAYLRRRWLLTMNYGAWGLLLLIFAGIFFYVFSLEKNNFEKFQK